jgi:hypothetical protein
MDQTFSPLIKAGETDALIKGWHRAVNASKAWADDSE